MSNSLRLSLKNDIAELEPIALRVNEFLEARAASPRAVYTANLALEEMITNIVKYGYDDKETHQINAVLEITGPQLTIHVEDDGHFFDPTQAPEPSIDVPIHAREVGGLGIYLLRQMLDEMVYERRGHRNVVTMRLAMNDPED